MKNKKGYTLIEVLTAFVIIAFILGIGVVSYNFIIDRVAANYYDTLEEELLLAGSDYFTNNRVEKPLSGYSAVQIDKLVGDKYIETLKDRKGNVCDSNSDSKVYIYKTDDGYEYEACLVCNDYKTEGTYCDGIAMGVINISAVKEGGGSYNPLLSFANASWSNSDVNVKFSVTVDVSEFVITDTSDGSTRTCDSISNKSCSMNFSKTSSYKVQAYNNGVEVAPTKGFNIKIDKDAPVCNFVSGPTVALINKSLTSKYVLSCTDNVGLSSDYNLASSDFTLTNSNVVLIQSPTATSIVNGYQYNIIVSGNKSGTTALTLKQGAITDKAGNGNVSVRSNNVEVDVDAPVISYNLASGTYEENKTVTVTVTDNRKISLIEYKLYKDDSLVSSGNPTGSSTTNISFDSNLNSDGTWKLEVTAKDAAGNTSTDSRSFIIESIKCEWVHTASDTPKTCTVKYKPSNPVEGDTYNTCEGPLGSLKWRFSHSSIACTVGNPIPGNTSGYTYGTAQDAEMACQSSWQSSENACYNREGGLPQGGNTCKATQDKYYYKQIFEYQCK